MVKKFEKDSILITGITVEEQMKKAKKILNEIVFPQSIEYEVRKQKNDRKLQ